MGLPDILVVLLLVQDVANIEGILPKGPTCHAYAWQIGPFWQDTLDMLSICCINVALNVLYYMSWLRRFTSWPTIHWPVKLNASPPIRKCCIVTHCHYHFYWSGQVCLRNFSTRLLYLNETDTELHEPQIFYPSGHWPETVTNAHVSAHFR